MLIRHNREPHTLVPTAHDSRPRRGARETRRTRRTWVRWSVLATVIALLLTALMAPTGQAQGAGEGSAEEQAVSATAEAGAGAESSGEAKVSAREQRAAARQAQREAKRERREAKRAARSKRSGSQLVQNGSRGRSQGDVHFSCTGVNWQFMNFPEGTNSVQTVIRIYSEGGSAPPTTIPGGFTFEGSSYEATTPLQAPPGEYKIDAWAKWNGNGLKGSFDILGRLDCAATPGFTVEKLQKIAGTVGPYTSTRITGEVGDTVDYEIVVKNNIGNVPLSIGSEDVVDHNCGPISGGARLGDAGGGRLDDIHVQARTRRSRLLFEHCGSVGYPAHG